MLGKVWLLNVWASWCVSCRQEHPVLVELAKSQTCRWSASTTRKCAATARSTSTRWPPATRSEWSSSAPPAWLAKHGDPYTLSVLDIDGRVGIDYGVYGVPETYVIDKAGIIRMKHTGPITPEVLSGKILPLLAELSK
jgi:cytochrome c biogenesis protein CcmG/thiol:disulfide interchange protein DsbE